MKMLPPLSRVLWNMLASPSTTEIVEGRSDILGSVFKVLAKLAGCLTHCHA
ncbi:MAG: hypothetical protein IIB77_01665 [Proteobacteria bacterium]|nr:hypothetical protein [Pseudomonadota bacterium]